MLKIPKKIGLKFRLSEPLKKKLIIILALVVLVLFLFNYKHLFIVALVNNRPITRLALIGELEKQGAKQTLETLITKSLILQEAGNQGIEITREKIEEKVGEIEEQVKAQGTDLDTLLETQGRTRRELEEEVKLQLIIEEILGKEIEITEEELQSYFEENKEYLGEEANFEEMKEDLKEQLRQDKIGQKVSVWLEELKANANITYF